MNTFYTLTLWTLQHIEMVSMIIIGLSLIGIALIANEIRKDGAA